MRNHILFLIAVASAVLVIGFGLISIGVAEAQANDVGQVGLNLWGNTWFLLGFCLVVFSARVILSFRVSQGCDLRRPVVNSVADGTLMT